MLHSYHGAGKPTKNIMHGDIEAYLDGFWLLLAPFHYHVAFFTSIITIHNVIHNYNYK